MQRYEEWADTIIEKIRKKMEWVSEKNKEKIPYRTDENGDYDDRSDPSKEWRIDDGLNWWTNGFWGGILWLLYQDTGEQRYADIARVSEQKMERCFQDFYGLHQVVGCWRTISSPGTRIPEESPCMRPIFWQDASTRWESSSGPGTTWRRTPEAGLSSTVCSTFRC